MTPRFSPLPAAFASLLFLVPLASLTAACTSSTDDEASPADETTSEQSDDLKKSKKKKPKLACAAVFGECVGLSPSSCVGGTWADASLVTCGGGIGVGCCVKPTPPPPPPPSECPELIPPAPGFCTDGHTQPIHNPTTGCLVGFECIHDAQNACAANGGQCVGLAPSACPSGHWGDAATHGCGGGIGVGCCLP